MSNGIGINQTVMTFATIGNNIFIGTGNGVYLTTNNGTSWSTVNNGLTSLDVRALILSGTNLFAGTFGNGVFLSTNNGTSWNAVNNGLSDRSIQKLAISGTTIFAATWSGSQGLYKSTNNGNSWSPAGFPNLSVWSLAVSGTNLFAGTATEGVFLSTNNGNSWTQSNSGLTNLGVYALLVLSEKIFAGTYGGNGGVFLSTNNGTNWNEAGLANHSLHTLTSSGMNIFAGTSNNGVFLSTNLGTNWFEINQGFAVLPSVLSSLISNNLIFAGTWNAGIWKRPLSDIFSIQAPTNLSYDKINNRLFWTLSTSFNIAKYLVYKKGSDNIWKSVADSGGMVNQDINFYNIQTSGFNYYKVGAISNTGDTAKCDSIYVNRGYVLRTRNSNIIESFKVKKHGFRFGNHETITNGEPLMWNYAWYSQFNYQYPPYPPYLNFLFSKSADYPDWPLFTEVYGRNRCYLYYLKLGNILDSSFLRKSVAKWSNIKYYPITEENPLSYNWRGTCFGFSISSLLAFYRNSAFYSQFPIMNNIDSVYGLLPSTYVKKMINHLQTTMNFNGRRTTIPLDSINQTPTFVLNLLEDRFAKTSVLGKLDEILGLYDNNGGGHAVVPYAIEKISETIKYLYIYDNEHPSIDTARLTINTSLNTCYYNMNNKEYKRMILVGSLESCLGEQSFDNEDNALCGKISNDTMMFFNSTNNSILYLDRNNDTISGFRITDHSFLGNKDLGFSPMTDGRVNPPIYYKIPKSDLSKVVFNEFISSRQKSYLSFDLDPATTYKIERIDSIQSNQSDIYYFDSSYFSFANVNPIQKKINLSMIISASSGTKKEKTFDIENFPIILNEAVSITKRNDNLVLKSEGTSKYYTLRLNYIDTSGNRSFFNPTVILAANTTHIVSPVWDSIKTVPVTIFVDLGNNGTIDDTMLVSDSALIQINNTNIVIPSRYALYQNYPNPFNPATTIHYDIVAQVKVQLSVFDILGREILILTNEEKKPGSYKVNWNASDYPSGIYFYKLKAGDFTETKKMILIK